jgi:hypothetical protein
MEWERGAPREAFLLPNDLAQVQRALWKKERLGFMVYGSSGQALQVRTCYEQAVGDGTYTLFISRENQISEEMVAAMSSRKRVKE